MLKTFFSYGKLFPLTRKKFAKTSKNAAIDLPSMPQKL